MALPWLLGAAAAAVIGAVIASSDDDSNKGSGGNNDDDNEEQRRRAERKAEKEREKAERKAARRYLTKQFDEQLSETKGLIEENTSPYFLMEFSGHCSIKEDINENIQHDFFGVSMQNAEMRPLRKTAVNLNYVKEVYDVEITPNIELHYALQEIENCKLALKEVQKLKKAILQTQKDIH